MKKLLALSTAIGLGVASLAFVPVDPGARAEAQRRAPARADLTYVTKAGASDQFEIQSSQLAVQRARRADVREFAQMMITDHNRTTQLVAEAARTDGVTPPPPMLEPRQRQMLRQLERAGGRNFDSVYLTQQLAAHQEALALHRARARSYGGAALTRVAASAVPVVQGHLAQVRRLSRTR